MEKARGRLRHVRMRETNASEPLLKHRNRIRWHQNQGLSDALGSAWRQPTYWPCGVRCAGGVTLILALTWNVRTCSAMPREKVQAATTVRPKVPMRRAGADRLVVAMKAGVTPVERRGRATVVGMGQPKPAGKGRSPLFRRKAVAFPRWHEPDDARVSSPVL